MIEILKSLSKKELVLAVLVVCFFLSTFILSIVCVVKSKKEKKIYNKISSLRIDLATIMKHNNEKIDLLDKKIDFINGKINSSSVEESSSPQEDNRPAQPNNFNIMRRR